MSLVKTSLRIIAACTVAGIAIGGVGVPLLLMVILTSNGALAENLYWLFVSVFSGAFLGGIFGFMGGVALHVLAAMFGWRLLGSAGSLPTDVTATARYDTSRASIGDSIVKHTDGTWHRQ